MGTSRTRRHPRSAALDRAIEKYRSSACLHFAAFAYVGESVSDPGKYYRNNVVGSLTLLEALRDHGVDQFVLSSTCATYGVPDKVPIDETLTQAPINPYGASKLMVERMLADFHAAHQVRSVALRYFNAAGADPDVEIGEDHDPETHLVPLVLDAASGDREAITVYGTDYETPDGTCIRDYIHVTDLAKAHVLALKALERGSHAPRVQPRKWPRLFCSRGDRVGRTCYGATRPCEARRTTAGGSRTTDQQFHARGKRIAMAATHYRAR
jgi:UDP-arabinose 4-epimerase